MIKPKTNLRQTAERIIEGIPRSYRDGDEEAGRERTVVWLMDLLQLIGCGAVLEKDIKRMEARFGDGGAFITSSQGRSEPNRKENKAPCSPTPDLRERSEADTKRLDWLDKNRDQVKFSIYIKDWTNPSNLREAIDAAMKEEK